MRSLYVCLSAVLLSVSVRCHTDSANGWSMTVANDVRADEGRTAVLPCNFTHPDTNLTLTGFVIWKKAQTNVIFNCTYFGPGHSQGEQCENMIKHDGGMRVRFVGNISNNDVSIMLEGLSQKDVGLYWCHVELNIGSFHTTSGTYLEVNAGQGELPVVTGSEGDSVTLPCIFRTMDGLTLRSITWMRKQPYQRIITFTAQPQGNWTTLNDGNRYKLIGNPKKGNASTTISQLSMRDNHTYLCVVTYTLQETILCLIQKESRVHVIPAASDDGWSMTVANGVRAEEGRTAVLPCSFTHPDTNLTLTGSVKWIKSDTGVIFNCAYPGLDHSQGELCENVRQQDDGNRFRFVGNLSNNDVSIMMDGLRQEDAGSYLCRVELNIGSFQTRSPTNLEVEASKGNVSVVTGTEGDSVTLPCIFRTWDSHTLTTVTWMRKEPYQHIVTFTAQSQGNWTIVNDGNRYELIGNPEEGNASTRINQLSVNDNHTFLCLVEYTSDPNFQYLIQRETRLRVYALSTSIPQQDGGLHTVMAEQKISPVLKLLNV
ncbi:uncharacterized protein LOC132206012 [Stegostoma tigrinum]|uniref:uncharacterized protein LOC132206012 n=1 Tax=Stegostoma tigrinum TaxID=3053191 RepID=UPI0028704ABA|nr:uncharacterized protein LOC132206012 [Stegostoma tigrinum]